MGASTPSLHVRPPLPFSRVGPACGVPEERFSAGPRQRPLDPGLRLCRTVSLRKREGWQKVRNRGPPRQCPAALAGLAQVINGDTLDIGTVWAGLHVIDAPESGQTFRAAGLRILASSRAAQPLSARCRREAPSATARGGERTGVGLRGGRAGETFDDAPERACWGIVYREILGDQLGIFPLRRRFLARMRRMFSSACLPCLCGWLTYEPPQSAFSRGEARCCAPRWATRTRHACAVRY